MFFVEKVRNIKIVVDCDDFFENINFKFIRIIQYKSAFYMNEKNMFKFYLKQYLI